MKKKPIKKTLPIAEEPKLKKNYFHIALIFILLLTIAVFWQCLSNGFTVYDDDPYVLNNPQIKDISINNISEIFSSFKLGNYFPLTLFTYMLEYKIWKLNPLGYHITNLLLHLLNIMLVFYFIRALTKNDAVGFLCALFFAIHPIKAESIAWIADRKDILYTFFYLAALIGYIQYKASQKGLFYILSIAAFILSLLSKGTAISLPAVLIIIDIYIHRKSKTIPQNTGALKLNSGKRIFSGISIADKIPFFILSIIFGIIAVYARRHYEIELNENRFNFSDKFLLGFHRLTFYYFLRILAPVNLSLLLPNMSNKTPILPSLSIFTLNSLIIIAAATILIRISRKTFIPVFGVLFFLITIFPALSVVVLGYSADRFTYLPSVGIIYLFSEALLYFYNADKKLGEWVKPVAASAVIIIIVVLSAAAYKRCLVWQNTETLMTDAIKHYPNEAQFYYNRGNEYAKNEKFDKALSDYTQTINKDQNFYDAYINRGNVFVNLGNIESAFADFNRAILLNQSLPDGYIKRGYIMQLNNDTEPALRDFNKAIAIAPNSSEAYYNRGNLYSKLGKFDEAIKDYTKATELSPDFIDPYRNRLIAYAYLKQPDKINAEIQHLKKRGIDIPSEFIQALLQEASGLGTK